MLTEQTDPWGTAGLPDGGYHATLVESAKACFLGHSRHVLCMQRFWSGIVGFWAQKYAWRKTA